MPEGYCPPNFQQFFNDLAARLIVTPNQNFTSFVIGSLQPTSNQGPWLKDCSQWFVYDDTLSKYVPESQSFNNFQVFDADGNFTVPDDIYRIKVEAWGAGGGGASNLAAQGGGGGGGGAYGLKYFNVIPSQSHAVMIGVAGTGGSPGTDATDTTMLTMVAGGGKGGALSTGMGGEGGLGGIVTGADIGVNGENGITSDGILGQAYGGSGGQAPNGGSGGTASITAAKMIGVTPGGGGAGGANSAVNTGGNGAPGRLIVWW